MKRYLDVIFVVLFFGSCTHSPEPFSNALKQQIDSFIERYPDGDIINLTVSRLRDKDMLFISNSDSYNPEMTDGYYIYKSKLITYYQTDSTNRSSLVNHSAFFIFKDTIEGYNDCHSKISNFEYDEMAYLVDEKGNLSFVKDESSLKFKKQHIDLFYNKGLNEKINSFVNSDIGVVYELRFVKKSGRNFVMLRSMPYYDKAKYDGYYYDNQILIVLYNAEPFRYLFKRKWKNKTTEGIPSFRNSMIRDWNFPYPLKLEILDNGELKALTLKEGFTI